VTISYDPSTSIFGRIVTGDDVETWCLDLFRRWTGTYLSEVERQHGLAAGFWARPRGFVRVLSFDKWPEDQLPVVMLVSTGVANPPERRGDGVYYARWIMGLGVLCSARSEQETHDMARHYIAAIRALVSQRPSLEGLAQGVKWMDESYTPLPYDDSRSLCAGQAIFQVDVDDVTTTLAGPATPDDPLEPDTDPWAVWPTVQTHDETVVNSPVNEPLPDQEGT
jgi:hypothetical protein